MKKLNKKGFTLIELLAVIVILAVVMVVTIPSVINSMNSARSGQLQNAADTVSKWLTDNYELASLTGDLGGAPDQAYTTYMSGKSWSNILTLDANVLAAAGVSEPNKNIDNSNNVYKAKARLVGNKICVTLMAKQGGSFYVNSGENTKSTKGCAAISLS